MGSFRFRCVVYTWVVSLLVSVVGSGVSLAATPGVINARIISRQLSDQNQKLTHVVIKMADSSEYDVSVAATAEPVLSKVTAGHALEVAVDDVKEPATITRVGNISLYIRAQARLIALFVSFLALSATALVVTKGDPLRFLVGVDNRYSNSQTQIVLWFGALATVYLATVLLRIHYLGFGYVGGVGIAAHVIELTGLSALSFGGAKVIMSQKSAQEPAVKSSTEPATPASAAPPGGAPPPADPAAASEAPGGALGALAPAAPKPRPQPNLLRDLFQNNYGQADFGDFQMLLVTLTAVIIFLISCFMYLADLWPKQTITLPDVDTALLSAFGLGQGAYLLKKAASEPGRG